MRRAAIYLSLLIAIPLSTGSLLAQSPGKVVTVPVTLDHNRIVIDVYVPLKDGTTKRVRGLVDTGSSQVMISERVAQIIGSGVSCNGQICSTRPPQAILVGGMRIPFSPVLPAATPVPIDNATDVLIAGMSPEVVIPATVLASYDLLIDYANRQFTIGPPGSIKFAGTAIPIKVADNGQITLPAKVDGRSYDFGLDTGLSGTLVKAAQLEEWHKNAPSWPYVAGALAAANVNGSPDELHRQMVRAPSLQLGSITLQDVLLASTAEAVPGALTGLLSGEAFKGARVGIDYAHSTLYVEQVNNPPVAAGLDVVGLTLRPEVDGRYTVVAVVPYEGQPSVADVKTGDVLVGVDGAPVTGATMGQVWSLLGGEPGQTRKLIIERDGKRSTAEAIVRRFLAEKKN
jgi:predicted aspartyl protease